MKLNYVVLLVLLISILMTSCSTEANDKVTGEVCDAETETCNFLVPKEINVDKIEVYHFHATNQCYSCITVGDLTEETLKTYFSEELKSGKIVFNHINGELAENKDLVMKYGATGSSIWIGVYDGDSFTKEENVNVWYKISDKKVFMTYFKGVIEQKLKGN